MKLKTHVLGMRLKQPFCGPWPTVGGKKGWREGRKEGGRSSIVTDVGLQLLLYYNFKEELREGK